MRTSRPRHRRDPTLLNSRAGEDDECRALHPHLPEKPDASLALGTLTLKDPWETVLFNDRALKHEVEAFDGDRPCSRCVIVGSAWKSTSEVAP